MDYVCPVNDLEKQLKEAGEQLALPHSSTKELLELLDKIEQFLTFVGQAPSISMQSALVPSMGALISDQLVKHSDVDVRVSVASCLCEVARITAPDPPYKDEIMKEIFHLNVMAFGELLNTTGRSYYKVIHILESVAKVKSCLLMLDLECDALVLEMFKHFLDGIRKNHPHTVFSDMETIMTLVIEESDEIATELLSLLLSHVRKENQNVLPVPWKLAEKVLRNCNDTLKSYSQTVMKLIQSDTDDYAEVVTALCQNAYQNETGTPPTKTNNIHKRDVNTLENGGSTKTMHSQPKKQKYTDTQRVSAGPKKIDRKPDTMSSKLDEPSHKNRLKGKELEASQNLDSAHESLSAKGRSRNKKNNLSQDSKKDLKRTRFQDKASPSGGVSSKEKSKGVKGSTEKQSTKTKGVAKGNTKTSGSLYNIAIKKEDEDLTDSVGAEPLLGQMNDKAQDRRKPTSSKKHVANGSHGKDLQNVNTLKKYGKELVGHRIKVWWPLDRMYYEGAVSSYNSLDKKHKVLYADGDEELLDLRHEKWSMLNDLSPDQLQEQVADLTSPMTTSAKRLKPKGKRKIESSLMQVDNYNSPKSPAPAYSSKTRPTKEHDITMDVLCTDNQKRDPVKTSDISTEKVEQDGKRKMGRSEKTAEFVY
ncbi:uncharacterized protein LOC112510439 isoform X2 [Cynara cardunculus var. scolymus]|uniref:uncharacterized protein LOC112510439 isoform X2 n=1 Tax=Cynara cardunculus var. scolymus TaxID=59895 RepID=UPI000D6232DA|nr:uncharacterized protein LOC112510439 isoform X2 [Cynara cardunculus var. scolymus]